MPSLINSDLDPALAGYPVNSADPASLPRGRTLSKANANLHSSKKFCHKTKQKVLF